MQAVLLSVWFLFYLTGPTTVGTIGPAGSKEDCQSVERQLREKLPIRQAACIEIPIYKDKGAQ